jgi:hypothetical protein
MNQTTTLKAVIIPSNFTETINQLSTNLKSVAPVNSETTQIINYVLIATAITGIFVYHYIKNQETE